MKKQSKTKKSLKTKHPDLVETVTAQYTEGLAKLAKKTHPIPAKPQAYLFAVDPSVGNSKTGIVAATVEPGENFTINLIDSRVCKEAKDFTWVVLDKLEKFCTHIRKDVRIPILVIIEAQNSWNSDVVEDQVVNACKRGESLLSNIHFIYDIQRRGHVGTEDIRTGVAFTKGRQPNIFEATQYFITHEKLRRTDVLPEIGWKRLDLKNLVTQLGLIKRYPVEAQVYSDSGKKKPPPGKVQSYVDDALAQTVQLLVYFGHQFLACLDYQDQREKFFAEFTTIN